MQKDDCSDGFCGIGNWQGIAEVYDSSGRFIANGADQRHVRTQMEDGRTRIDLAFVGPLKFAGHYFIKSEEDHRLYQGPVNCGYADSLGKDGVSAHAYWPLVGLSQKFFLMMTPDGQKQVSLALMSRGEHFLYGIVGENTRVDLHSPPGSVGLISGISADLEQDPASGRGEILLHRAGFYEGELSSYEEGHRAVKVSAMRQKIQLADKKIEFTSEGGSFQSDGYSCHFDSNGWQSWTGPGDFVGSYSMYGGRALSGTFHDLKKNIRVWRREVITSNGEHKAMVNIWYAGEKKLGTEWGFLKFRAHPT